MPEVLLSSAGISKSLLDQIDLQDIDVIKGKKYIGSDGKLHTGSLIDQPNDNQCPVVTKYDPDTGFVYLAIPRGAYRKTDGRMSPHPNIKRRLTEIVGEAGFNRGQYQYAGGIGSGTDENGKYYAFNRIPEGFYSSNGADWAPEIRISEETYLAHLPGASWQMRFVSPNADNQEHRFTFDLPDGAGTYGWGCTGYIYWGNENSGLHFAFADANYPLKTGNNQNFTFHGTTRLDAGSNNFSYRCWGGSINFYYCRIR